MRVIILVLLALTYQVNSHNEHGNPGGQPPAGQENIHVTRKMEEYVHDMEYEEHFFFFIQSI